MDNLEVEITIPRFVTDIEEKTIYECTSHQQALLYEHLSLCLIGAKAFESSSIIQINIPLAVSAIKKETFRGSQELSRVEFAIISVLRLISERSIHCYCFDCNSTACN